MSLRAIQRVLGLLLMALSLTMLLGRLETFTLLSLFTVTFWRK